MIVNIRRNPKSIEIVNLTSSDELENSLDELENSLDELENSLDELENSLGELENSAGHQSDCASSESPPLVLGNCKLFIYECID